MAGNTAFMVMKTAWAEAVRSRSELVRQHHVLLGLGTLGGTASRLLAQHGLTPESMRKGCAAVESAYHWSRCLRPRPSLAELREHVGDICWVPSARRIVDRGSTDVDILAELASRPTDTVRAIFAGAQVKPDAVVAATKTASALPCEVRPIAAGGYQFGKTRCGQAVRARYFISASAQQVFRTVRSPETMLELGGFDQGQVHHGDVVAREYWWGRRYTVRFSRVVDTPEGDQVMWKATWNRPGAPGAMFWDFRFANRVDGCEVTVVCGMAVVGDPVGVGTKSLAAVMPIRPLLNAYNRDQLRSGLLTMLPELSYLVVGDDLGQAPCASNTGAKNAAGATIGGLATAISDYGRDIPAPNGVLPATKILPRCEPTP